MASFDVEVRTKGGFELDNYMAAATNPSGKDTVVRITGNASEVLLNLTHLIAQVYVLMSTGGTDDEVIAKEIGGAVGSGVVEGKKWMMQKQIEDAKREAKKNDRRKAQGNTGRKPRHHGDGQPS